MKEREKREDGIRREIILCLQKRMNEVREHRLTVGFSIHYGAPLNFLVDDLYELFMKNGREIL